MVFALPLPTRLTVYDRIFKITLVYTFKETGKIVKFQIVDNKYVLVCVGISSNRFYDPGGWFIDGTLIGQFGRIPTSISSEIVLTLIWLVMIGTRGQIYWLNMFSNIQV